MSEAPPGPGHLVAGRFRLVERLGEGGMGTVWRADHVTLRSEVAVKLLHRAMLESDDGLRRFLAEAQAAALLRSPHVVQILDHGVDDGMPYIAMELLDGESLASRLASAGTLSLAETARLVTHVSRAIGKAHDAGIVHRDLKPDNIFLVRNDDEEIAKVLDFGIAKIAHGLSEPAAKVSTKEGSLLGTPYYMSPEQVRGHAIDWRSDLWSLAVIAYECMCGRVPFDAKTVGDLLLAICTEPIPVPSAARPVPEGFDAWFARGVGRDVAARFQSAREMAEALRALVDEDAQKSTSGRFAATPRVSVPAPARISGATSSAATLDAHTDPSSIWHDTRKIESAATIARAASAHETIGGASEVSVSRTPAPPARRYALAALGAAVLGVAAWFALADRAPRPAQRGADPVPRAADASARPAPPASEAPAPAGSDAMPPAASAGPAASGTAGAASAAPPSASASASAGRAHGGPRNPTSAPHKPAKDELLF